jgi:hypothetical protein
MADLQVGNSWIGSPIRLITASTSTGVGSSLDLRGGYSNFTAFVQPTTAGTGTMSARVEGSLDDTNWVALSAATTSSTAGRMFSSTAGHTVGFVRINVTALGSADSVVNGAWVAARP